MKTYPIPMQLLQEIVNYLQQQRWSDVNNLLVGINNLVRSVDDVQVVYPDLKNNGKDEAGVTNG